MAVKMENNIIYYFRGITNQFDIWLLTNNHMFKM